MRVDDDFFFRIIKRTTPLELSDLEAACLHDARLTEARDALEQEATESTGREGEYHES